VQSGPGEAAYEPHEFAFLRAIDDYKRLQRRPFPTWSEVLSVVWLCVERGDFNQPLAERGFEKKTSPAKNSARLV
jgi:hypothetical protein